MLGGRIAAEELDSGHLSLTAADELVADGGGRTGRGRRRTRASRAGKGESQPALPAVESAAAGGQGALRHGVLRAAARVR